MLKKIIVLGIVVVILSTVAFIMMNHYNTKRVAVEKIEQYIEKQKIPKENIYNESFTWDWENSGHYIKQFKVKDDDSGITYQYSFIAKDKPIVFIPYTSTAFEVKVKYPAPEIK
ncbi:DUF3139 domain-containing protein [Listeria sp. FSL L7-1582]|uniref:DUF3139 domain-containing protein n=1 Tax=Listeria portnoyi TaxID=2713504 RepID=UPI00164DFFDA|nr:DUF3139 domain-containing protein [Listeria portnoyi]MBC6309522.1 DUF3139 domain-containing protein [Listeria portnoyi]